MPAPPDTIATISTCPEKTVTFPSELALTSPLPKYFVVNILALLEIIAGITTSASKVLPAKTTATSPAPPDVVAISTAPPAPEFSVIDIPNWEISATTSGVPEIAAGTLAPSEATVTATPPLKITCSDSGRKMSMRMLQIVMRNLVAMATLAASIIMLFNEQQIHLSGFQVTENYRFSPAFQFFVIGNGVACIYAFFSMIIIICYGSNIAMHFFDTLMMGLVVAAAAAATAVSYIGRKGNPNAFWRPVCNYAEDFCYHSAVSIGCSYLGFLLLLLVFTSTFISRLS